MSSHVLQLRRIKPFGAWQALCSCGRFESASSMSQDAVVGEHALHAARAAGSSSSIILMREARREPSSAAASAVVVDVDRLMARLVGPVLFVVTGWWLLTAGGVL